MSLSILIDMNLSPDWARALRGAGYQAIHWSAVGDPRATDRQIMDWAAANKHIVFTHDLDFGTTLALTHATGPSVIQVRADDVLPSHLGKLVIAALKQHETDLLAGALVVVDELKNRVRVLPM
jgi:predicted nuclease of predicted toxin-antitoxin system